MYVTQDPLVRHPDGVSIGEHRAAGRRRLLAAPLWISLQLMMIAVIVMGLLVQGEYVMMRLVIDELLPGATADQRTAVGIVVTLAYLIVWASVGFCVARASAVIHEVGVPGGKVPRMAAIRQFGVVGAIAVIFELAVMAGAAYSRADALATTAGRDARSAEILSNSEADEAVLDAVAKEAYDNVFGRDLLWTLLTLGVLAIAALVAGLAVHSLAKSAGVGIAEARIGRARRQADRARADMVKAQAEVEALQAAKQARAEGARKAEAALTERYHNHGPAHARVYLVARKGNPEFTDYLIPAPGPES